MDNSIPGMYIDIEWSPTIFRPNMYWLKYLIFYVGEQLERLTNAIDLDMAFLNTLEVKGCPSGPEFREVMWVR